MHKLLVCAGLVAGLGMAACGDDTSDTGGDGGSSTTSTTATGMGSTSNGGQCLAFGADCTTGDTCCAVGATPGECFAFGMGSKCTIPCPADPADCPNNGAGCNMMMPTYCKTE